MHVFITGGTGLVGSAVVAELINNGHPVLALTRSDKAADAITAAGGTPLRGSLSDLDILREGARQSEGVVHLAFANDFSSSEALAAGIAEETAALTALGEELVGTNRPLVTVSGTPWVKGRQSTEQDPVPTEGPVGGRGVAVNATLALASRGVRSMSVRLPRTVHNKGSGGFAGMLIDFARQTGQASYPGDGQQRWPAVHALDAAVLFRLALERGEPGTAWHAVADEGDKVRDIATVIGRKLGLPVASAAAETFGALGPIFAADQPASSTHTRKALGWDPKQPSLLADLENIMA
jgi:nucleoside-diphosphate-sugar epimerase